MGVQDMRVYVIDCDDCENPYESDFGDTYFEDDHEARDKARGEGWQVGTENYYAAAVCPDCIAKRKRAEEGKPELPEEIPGQLDLLAEVR